MRKVTKQIAEAFKAGKSKTVANTTTDGKSIWLHGNKIAEKQPDGSVLLTLAGWPTVTTRERLNGIIDTLADGRFRALGFSQRKGEQFFGSLSISADDTIRFNPTSGMIGIVGADSRI